MVLKVTENAWVKVPPKPQRRRKQIDPAEQKEALCSPLRYFSCTPMGSKDRIRMLSRHVSGTSGMIDINRAPSPVNFDEGAGLMFANGSRGGSNGGRRSRPINDRVVSAPVHVRPHEPSIYEEEEIVEVIEEASTVGENRRSHRSHRSHCCSHRHDGPGPIPHDTQSTRSASPPPESVASSRHTRHTRQRDPLPPPRLPASQARAQHRTVSTPAAAPRPMRQTEAPGAGGYRFESAIFQPRGTNYRDVGRGGATGTGGGRWASATSALSFD